jgi:hypothetical protein
MLIGERPTHRPEEGQRPRSISTRAACAHNFAPWQFRY